MTRANRIIHDICPCGCSKLAVPYHLRFSELWVRVAPEPGQESVRFGLEFEAAPNDRGWRNFP